MNENTQATEMVNEGDLERTTHPVIESPVQTYQNVTSAAVTKEELNWRAPLDYDLRQNEEIAKINNLNDLVRDYLGLKKNTVIPEEYTWTVPEGYEVNDETSQEFNNLAKDIGLTQHQYEKVQDFAFGMIKDVIETETSPEEYEKLVRECEDELKEKWGSAYEENMKKAHYTVSKIWNNLGGVEYAEKLGVANDPNFIALMAEVGNHITEHSYHVGSQSAHLNTFENRINEILSDTQGPYFDESHPRHKTVVDEVRSLYNKIYKE